MPGGVCGVGGWVGGWGSGWAGVGRVGRSGGRVGQAGWSGTKVGQKGEFCQIGVLMSVADISTKKKTAS